MSQTKPHPWRHPPPKPVPWRVYLAGLPRGESLNPRELFAKLRRQGQAPRSGGRAGCARFDISHQWVERNDFGLRVTVEAGQALACLYSGARLYKGPGQANLSQSAATRSTGNISVWVQKVGHSNTRGIVSSLFFSRSEITAALHYQHLMKTKG